MTLAFDLTKEDLFSLELFCHNRKSFTAKNKPLLMGLSAVAIVLLGRVITGDFRQDPIFYLLVTPPIILFIVVLNSEWFLRFKSGGFSKEWEQVCSSNIIVIEPQYFLVKLDNIETKFEWQAFKSLEETKEHLFLFETTGSAFIIPKRIFLLPQEEYDVKSFIERKLA